jgi:hypothetical protein
MYPGKTGWSALQKAIKKSWNMAPTLCDPFESITSSLYFICNVGAEEFILRSDTHWKSYAAFRQESKSFRILVAGLSFHIVNRCKQIAQACMAN